MFDGVITALVTPFRSDGEIDVAALARLVERQIQGGVSGLVPCGTTGESPTLSEDEKRKVIDVVIETSRGRVPVIPGTGGNVTHRAVALTKFAKEAGASATLQVCPYYNKPTDEGLLRHYGTIADAVDLSLVLYNIPSRTGRNIATSVVLSLAEHPNVVGVKEASGDLGQIGDIIAGAPTGFSVLAGDDAITLAVIALGGRGVISATSNVAPEKMSGLVAAALAGNFSGARELHYALLPLFKGLFIETNPGPVKTALAMMGLVEEIFRAPLCTMEGRNRNKLREVIEAQGFV